MTTFHIEGTREEVLSAVELAHAIAAQIRPTLARQPVWVQGAVLAELISNFLAGQVVEGDPGATEIMRIALLEHLVEASWSLVTSGDSDVAGHA